MLTINADSHPPMDPFHKTADEKSIIEILPPERYDEWLQANAKGSREFL